MRLHFGTPLPARRAQNRLGVTKGARVRVRPARRTLKLALLAASAALSAALGAGLGEPLFAHLSPEHARIASLAISGNVHTDPAQIAAASGLAVGALIAQVDEQAVARRLEALPWVARAHAAKLLPNRVVVRIEERVPVAVARLADGSRQLVDASGVAFAPAPSDSHGPELLGLAALPAPGRASPELAAGVALLAAWRTAGLPAASGVEVAGAAPAELPAVRVAERPLRVLFGDGERAEQLERLARILAAGGDALAAARAIDLRFPGQGVVRFAAPCPAEAELLGGTGTSEEVSVAPAREGDSSCHAKTT
jgi:cell division protein FtsQ